MTASKKDHACPDCPARRTRMLEVLVDEPAGCVFRCLPVSARQPLPVRWGVEYAIAFVRRGIVIRQRVDGAGRASAIDIAGPGSVLPITNLSDESVTGYAVDDAMLCLASADLVDTAVTRGPAGARDVVRAQTVMRERVERLTEARTRQSALAGVGCLLLAIADTLSPAVKLTRVPAVIQQRDLASLVGLRHESVCRAIATLEERGLVARTPDGLELVDRAKLAAL